MCPNCFLSEFKRVREVHLLPLDRSYRWTILTGGSFLPVRYVPVDHSYRWIVLTGGPFLPVDHSYR